jgi:hypothetical protein
VAVKSFITLAPQVGLLFLSPTLEEESRDSSEPSAEAEPATDLGEFFVGIYHITVQSIELYSRH